MKRAFTKPVYPGLYETTASGSALVGEDKYQCVDCNKDSVKLQEGETIDYMWLSEADFIEFVNSGKMIDMQKDRFHDYLVAMNYIA